MATINPSSSEDTLNFFRLARLVLDVCGSLLRDVLKNRLTSDLSAALKSNEKKLAQLPMSVLGVKQWTTLYPPRGVCSYEDLDVSLLYVLLLNIGNITWRTRPHPTDRSLSANIDRIRTHRNEAVCHVITASVSTPVFNTLWQNIRDCIDDIAATLGTASRDQYAADVGRLATESIIDPQTKQAYIDEMKQLFIAVRETNQMMKEVQDNVGELTKVVADLKDSNPTRASMIDDTSRTIQNQTGKVKKITETKAFKAAQEKLLNNSIVVVKGCSGDGKTFLCYQLLKWLSSGDNGDKCKRPLEIFEMDKWHKLVVSDLQLAVFIDNVSEDIVKYLKKRENQIESLFSGNLDNTCNCLILNIKTEAYKRSTGKIFETSNFLIDLSGEYRMTKEEKKQMLCDYTPTGVNLSDHEIDIIESQSPDIGFPQCCRLFKDTPDLHQNAVEFFKAPFKHLREVMNKIGSEKWAALLFLFLNEGSVRQKDLDPYSKNVDWILSLIDKTVGINLRSHEPNQSKRDNKGKISALKDNLDDADDSLLRKTMKRKYVGRGVEEEEEEEDEYYIEFSHNSILDTVGLLYGEITLIGFIQNCPLRSLVCITTDREAPNRILISPNDTDMYERLLSEFVRRPTKYDSVIALEIWTDTLFVKGFFRWLFDDDSRQQTLGQLVDDDGATVLHTSCIKQQKVLALYLCEKYPDLVGCRDEDGRHCLHLIARYTSDIDFFTEVESHVKKYVESNNQTYDITSIRTKWGESVLHMSCMNTHKVLALYLCEKYPDLVGCRAVYGYHCLHLIARFTSDIDLFTEVESHVKKYVESNNQTYDITSIRTKRGQSVLHLSCKNRQKVLALYLCEKYPDLVGCSDVSGRHCLHLIAESTSDIDFFTEVESHVKKYVESNNQTYDITSIRTKWGESVLHMSCMNTHKVLALYLCEKYPDLVGCRTVYGQHCLHYIAESTSDIDFFTEVESHVKKYVESNNPTYDITSIRTEGGESVLHKSCENTHKVLTLYLCEKYPDLVGCSDVFGRHCLHYIAESTSDIDFFTEVESHVKKYVESNNQTYDITSIRTEEGESVLHMSCMNTQKVLALYLCEKYPDLVGCRNVYGLHCLHHIARYTSDIDLFTEVESHVKKYVESNNQTYDITSIRTERGESVLHMSCMNTQKVLALYLCEKYPDLVGCRNVLGWHCLHHIAGYTSDIDLFTEVESHVKKYVESNNQTYDITSIRTEEGESVLHMSCMYTQKVLALYLCEKYPDLVGCRNVYGYHCLHYIAGYTSDIDLFTEVESHVKKYVESNNQTYDITSIRTERGESVLHFSCMNRHKVLALYLCEKYPDLVGCSDEDGHHCLHHIAEYTSDIDLFTEVESHVKKYVESNNQTYDITSIRTEEGESVLHMSCMNTQKVLALYLCEKYPDLVGCRDEDGHHCLHYIAESTSDIDLFTEVESHVKKYVESNNQTYDITSIRTEEGESVLHMSCMYTQKVLALYLCEKYPDLVGCRNVYGYHCLHYIAGYTSDIDLFTEVESHVKKYVESNNQTYDITSIRTEEGESVLHMSCMYTQKVLALYLCEKYPDLVGCSDEDGHHCLHYIAESTSDIDLFTEVESHVKKYVESNNQTYDITSIRTEEGESVLHMSCMNTQKVLALYLCEKYPDLVGCRNVYGYHCLHYIAGYTSDIDLFTEVESHVKKYVESNNQTYDITSIRTERGESVLHLSCMYTQKVLALYLCEKYPDLVGCSDEDGHHCLHYIAESTSDIDLFTEVESHVKKYVESNNQTYDITSIRTEWGESVLDAAKRRGTDNNPLYDHLRQIWPRAATHDAQ